MAIFARYGSEKRSREGIMRLATRLLRPDAKEVSI